MSDFVTLTNEFNADFWSLIESHEMEHDYKLEMEKINIEEMKVRRDFLREVRAERLANRA